MVVQRQSDSLRVASGLSLDADYIAGGSIALLGKRGAGKTFACRVLAEELFDAHVQTVIIDPMGVFWGLRSSADGEHDGLPIPVFGGGHGDAPLESSAGMLMADLAVEDGLSMILDLSGFGSRTQERTFVGTFLDRLYRTNRELVHLIVDEADLFAPQKPRREDAHLLVTMENIVRRGRNKAIGITNASQRAAVLNKDVLTQIDVLVALRVAAPQDRDAIGEWVRGQGDETQWSSVAASLPTLANGEGWWWIPEKGILDRVQIRKTRTFDSSPTRRRGDGGRTPKTFADVDLAAISDRIAATIERVKADDPRELHRRIGELEKRLRTQQLVPSVDRQLQQRIEQTRGDLRRLEAQVRAIKAAANNLPGIVAEQVRTLVESVVTDAAQIDHDVAEATVQVRELETTMAAADSTISQPGHGVPEAQNSAGRRSRSGAAASAQPASANGSIPPARQRILDALAEMESIGINPVDKTQLALWAGVSPKSSGYANNLGALRTSGHIDYPAPARVHLTEIGRDAAAVTDDPITSPKQLHRRIETLISPARWRILAVLIDTYPAAMTREDLAASAGASPVSSGYANNLGALRSLGLLDYPSRGHVRASQVMFLRHLDQST